MLQTAPPVPALPAHLQVGESRRMTPADYERDIRHFSLITKDKDFPFDLGDAVAVYYENLKDSDAVLPPGPSDPPQFCMRSRGSFVCATRNPGIIACYKRKKKDNRSNQNKKKTKRKKRRKSQMSQKRQKAQKAQKSQKRQKKQQQQSKTKQRKKHQKES